MGVLRYLADKLYSNDKEVAVINSPMVATAWVNFDGFTGTIHDSYNVSSLTRNSAGNYDINFLIPMDNLTYTTAGGTQYGDFMAFDARTVDNVRLLTLRRTSATTERDGPNISVIFFGGKA